MAIVRKAVNAVVGTIGLVSCLCCFVFLAFIGYTWFRIRRGANQAESRLLRAQFGLLFCSLIASDFIGALGFVMCYRWIDANGRAPVAGPGERAPSGCTFQGVALTAGDLGSALFTLWIAIHTCNILSSKWRPSDRLVQAIVLFTWVAIFLLEIVPPLVVRKIGKHGPFYNGVGYWCFSGNQYQWLRFGNHYIFIFVAAIGSLLIYAFVTLRVYRHYRHASAMGLVYDKAQMVSVQRIMLFPLAYWLVAMPLAGYRMSQLAGAEASDGALAFAGITFASSGTINLLLYSWTRNLLHLGGGSSRSKSNPQITVNVQTAVHQESWSSCENLKRPPLQFKLKEDYQLERFDVVNLPPSSELIGTADKA